jgi:hypothetical protein
MTNLLRNGMMLQKIILFLASGPNWNVPLAVKTAQLISAQIGQLVQGSQNLHILPLPFFLRCLRQLDTTVPEIAKKYVAITFSFLQDSYKTTYNTE